MTKTQIWKLFHGSIAPLKVTREAALRGELPADQFPSNGFMILGNQRSENTVFCQDSWTDPSTYKEMFFHTDSEDFTDWVLARPQEEQKTNAHCLDLSSKLSG